MLVESSSLVKVAAAFLIGVVVALGSALIYVRTSDIPEKPFNAAPAILKPSQAPEPDLPSVPKTETDVVVKEQPKPLPKRGEIGPKLARAAQQQRHQEPITVIAQAHSPTTVALPPSTPVRMPNPAPVVNDPTPLPSVPEPAPIGQTAPTPAANREAHVITLQAGTNLAIRLGETLASDHNYTGDTFRATLEAPIIVDGFIIADRGSKVLGKVVNAQQAGRVEGLSGLTLALVEINTTDGQRVRIQTDLYSKQGPGSAGSDAAKIAGGAALGAIIGAIAGGGKGAAIGAGAGGAAGTGVVLATRGKPTALPSETRLTFRLSAPVTITEQLNN